MWEAITSNDIKEWIFFHYYFPWLVPHINILIPLLCFFAGMLKVIKQKSRIPVFVMIRPRGGDFLYTEEEFEVMKEEIKILKEAGADGVVFGILTRFVSVLCVFIPSLLQCYINEEDCRGIS